jgi:uncharacterized secreted protein with C-terminal beta-propeller domain
LTGSYNSLDVARNVVVSGNYAYVADSRKGLLIIDISNPSSPVLAGTYNIPGGFHGVFVSGNYAYVINHQGLQIIDISNPSSPTFTDSYDTPGAAFGVTVSGNYAYVADGFSRIPVLDISDPSDIKLIAELYTRGSSWDLFLNNGYLYSADGWAGLSIIASDSISIEKVSTLSGQVCPLYQTFPNPFHPHSMISFNVAKPVGARSDIVLGIYNIQGQLLRSLPVTGKKKGDYSVIWDGRNNAGKPMCSGVYFSNLRISNKLQDTRRIVLMR